MSAEDYTRVGDILVGTRLIFEGIPKLTEQQVHRFGQCFWPDNPTAPVEDIVNQIDVINLGSAVRLVSATVALNAKEQGSVE